MEEERKKLYSLGSQQSAPRRTSRQSKQTQPFSPHEKRAASVPPCSPLKESSNAVHNFLCDLAPGDNRPFGGKLMLLGGDWKQLLPVVRGTYNSEIINYTFKKSSLWDNFKVLSLSENMRLERGAGEFANFLTKVGSAEEPVHNSVQSTVEISKDMCLESEDAVIKWAYEDSLDVKSCEAIKETCILCVLNESTMEVNKKVLAMLGGHEKVMKSVDRCCHESKYMELPAEVYNNITPCGLPPHKLSLKEGCIVVLLRNLNVPLGQCNGTRLRVVKIEKNLLHCENLLESFKNQLVLLPSIEMTPSDLSDPSHCFTRLQFPVRLSYAMTINKAQGQSLSKVGVILKTPVFSHGQLCCSFTSSHEKWHSKLATTNACGRYIRKYSQHRL